MARRGTIRDYSPARLRQVIKEVSIASDIDLSPGGNHQELQFNNNGNFGSVSDVTWDGTDVKVSDATKIKFGTNSDAYISYNNNGDDFLTISGSANGIVLSGSTVQIRGTLEGASPLKIAGGIEIVPSRDGEAATAMSFGNNIKLFFGDDDDSYVQFNNTSENYLELSGSDKGIVLSGTCVYVDKYLGVGVDPSNITHAITLPDNADNSGQIRANAYLTYSSLKYKKNIQTIEDPIDIISHLRGVTFTWKQNEAKDYGFIAEEVGKKIPDIVEWDKNNTNKTPSAVSMNYSRIIPILVEGIKSQQDQIDKLKSEIIFLKRGAEP